MQTSNVQEKAETSQVYFFSYLCTLCVPLCNRHFHASDMWSQLLFFLYIQQADCGREPGNPPSTPMWAFAGQNYKG